MPQRARFVLAAMVLALACQGVSAQCMDTPWEALDDSSSWWRPTGVSAMTAWDRDGSGPERPALTVAGSFAARSGEERTSIGVWNGSQWELLGAPVSSVSLGIMSLEVYRGELYAGGDQTFSSTARNLARWNGTEWVRVGSGTSARVYCLKVYRDKLYIGSEPGWPRVWDGQSFSYIPISGMTVGGASSRVTALCEHQERLIIAGSFVLGPLGGQVALAHNVIAWDGASLQLLAEGINDGSAYYLNYQMVSNGDRLMVGAEFWHGSGQWHPFSVSHVLAWDGERWSAQDDGSGYYPMTFLSYEDRILQFSLRVESNVYTGPKCAQWIGGPWLDIPTPSYVLPRPGSSDATMSPATLVLDNKIFVAQRPSVMHEPGIIHLKLPCRTCVADVDNGTGLGVPDRAVGIDDLVHYLGAFEQGRVSADVDDGTSTGTRDDAVGVADLVYFLERFSQGC